MNEMNLSIRRIKEVQGVCNDTGVCFLGEASNLITYSDLSTYFGVGQGTINSTTTGLQNAWLNFKIDDKELYVSKVTIKNSISWDHLYSLGLVYGTNDNGLYSTGTPTNQYRTITLGGKLYKCRLLKGADPDIDGVSWSVALHDSADTQNSEWSKIFYPIINDDPNIASYTGPMLANYTEADLQMRWINDAATPGSYNWCQERHVTTTTSRIVRGYYGPSRLAWVISSTRGLGIGWRPCLELVT